MNRIVLNEMSHAGAGCRPVVGIPRLLREIGTGKAGVSVSEAALGDLPMGDNPRTMSGTVILK